jgi:hypothetical protein
LLSALFHGDLDLSEVRLSRVEQIGMGFVGIVFREEVWDPSGDTVCYDRISGRFNQ